MSKFGYLLIFVESHWSHYNLRWKIATDIEGASAQVKKFLCKSPKFKKRTFYIVYSKGEYTDQCLYILVLVSPYWPKILYIVGIKCEKTIAT